MVKSGQTAGWPAAGLTQWKWPLICKTRGCRRIVYTDISRDGTMEGPNIEAYKAMANNLKKVCITASGGVGDYTHLIKDCRFKTLKSGLNHRRQGPLRKQIPLPANLVLA